MAEKKVTSIIHVFDDGTAEVLEGQSLLNFIAHEHMSLNLAAAHGFKAVGFDWQPVSDVRFERK